MMDMEEVVEQSSAAYALLEEDTATRDGEVITQLELLISDLLPLVTTGGGAAPATEPTSVTSAVTPVASEAAAEDAARGRAPPSRRRVRLRSAAATWLEPAGATDAGERHQAAEQNGGNVPKKREHGPGVVAAPCRAARREACREARLRECERARPAQ